MLLRKNPCKRLSCLRRTLSVFKKHHLGKWYVNSQICAQAHLTTLARSYAIVITCTKKKRTFRLFIGNSWRWWCQFLFFTRCFIATNFARNKSFRACRWTRRVRVSCWWCCGCVWRRCRWKWLGFWNDMEQMTQKTINFIQNFPRFIWFIGERVTRQIIANNLYA